jgi:hypothetical protein
MGSAFHHRVALGLSLFGAALEPAPALACGGLFCANTGAGGGAPAPVDQNGERIVFVVDSAAGIVCSHVQIQYRGAADTFAWIVPVPAVPTIAESDPALFARLDAVTGLTVLPPPYDYSACRFPDSGGGEASSGCGCGDDTSTSAMGDAGGSGNADETEPPVTVYSEVTTDNYEAVVVGSESADELITWLRDNGFNFSDNMRPAVAAYVDEHLKFAAFRLRDGKTAQNIAPVVLCYEASGPAIPLRLTAVAAQPLMGIGVHILGDATFGRFGGESVLPDPEGIVFDPVTLQTNYFEWVARLADESDGQRWVLEYTGAHGVDLPLPGMEKRTTGFPWVTRFYTRLSAQHMTQDPVFVPGPGRNTAPAIVDLSSQTPIDACTAAAAPSACFDNYCGAGAECAAESGQAAHCLCAEGDVAQPVIGPDRRARVTCTPRESPLGITDEAAGAQGSFDPCNVYACGDGHCVLKNGFPACVCGAGAGAFVDPSGFVRCEAVGANTPRFGPGGGPESVTADGIEADAAPLQAPARPRLPTSVPWMAGLLVGRWMFVRRRGRRA